MNVLTDRSTREISMCKLFSELDSTSYAVQTRSIRIGCHVTSIRLENLFWDMLEDIAAQENMSLGKLLTKLNDEFIEAVEGVINFTALVRCVCIQHAVKLQDFDSSGTRNSYRFKEKIKAA